MTIRSVAEDQIGRQPTSTSFSSKIFSKSWGTRSQKPFMNAAIWWLTRSLNRHFITNLHSQQSYVKRLALLPFCDEENNYYWLTRIILTKTSTSPPL